MENFILKFYSWKKLTPVVAHSRPVLLMCHVCLSWISGVYKSTPNVRSSV